MKKFKLTFSFEDWKKGNELLFRLGFTKNFEFCETHELNLEDWQHQDLKDEFHNMDLEFEFEELHEN